jgi:hypothetical protein
VQIKIAYEVDNSLEQYRTPFHEKYSFMRNKIAYKMQVLICNLSSIFFLAHPVICNNILQRQPVKYFLDSAKLDLTMVLRMNIYSLTCPMNSGCPMDCCSWSILKLF